MGGAQAYGATCEAAQYQCAATAGSGCADERDERYTDSNVAESVPEGATYEGSEYAKAAKSADVGPCRKEAAGA